MAAGADTFIHAMIQEAGWINMLKQNRYPVLDEAEIVDLNPDCILLSSEPYPFAEKHVHELQSLLPNTKVLLVDGELFSWYGSRMSKSFDYFRGLNESIFS
jgi:ABC-type Fe3+-hydroxamate transport system substrate-binding protein